jgi:hypothetical protein
MTRRELYNKKGYWKRLFKETDLKVLQLLNFERSGAINVGLTEYAVLAHGIVKLGLTGEEILDRMVRAAMKDEPLIDMRNMINMVEVFSVRLKEIAEKKWGQGLDKFPVFKCSTATVGELTEKSRAIREMNDLLEAK